jgi:hypothetical protein
MVREHVTLHFKKHRFTDDRPVQQLAGVDETTGIFIYADKGVLIARKLFELMAHTFWRPN